MIRPKNKNKIKEKINNLHRSQHRVRCIFTDVFSPHHLCADKAEPEPAAPVGSANDNRREGFFLFSFLFFNLMRPQKDHLYLEQTSTTLSSKNNKIYIYIYIFLYILYIYFLFF